MTTHYSHMTHISGVMSSGLLVVISRVSSSIPHMLASRTLQD